MKFPVMIKDGGELITFTSENEGTFQSGAFCMSSLSDMMVRVECGSAEIINQGEEIVVRNVQGRLFRLRNGMVETSFNDGVIWFSTWKSKEWFNASVNSPIVDAPLGIFAG